MVILLPPVRSVVLCFFGIVGSIIIREVDEKIRVDMITRLRPQVLAVRGTSSQYLPTVEAFRKVIKSLGFLNLTCSTYL